MKYETENINDLPISGNLIQVITWQCFAWIIYLLVGYFFLP